MKERIDHSNYEAWLLDRLEGNLSPQDERALDAFLAANPGLDPGQGSLPTLDEFKATLSASAKNGLKRQLPPTGSPSNERLDVLTGRPTKIPRTRPLHPWKRSTTLETWCASWPKDRGSIAMLAGLSS